MHIKLPLQERVLSSLNSYVISCSNFCLLSLHSFESRSWRLISLIRFCMSTDDTLMHWDTLLTSHRTGRSTHSLHGARSEFQRDYDRIIFSAPFRRLQNKTQVFPLPGSVFVHNRLTHSIEVASVGRSLGGLVAQRLSAESPSNAELFQSIPSIVSAACLAHDMGNPPLGHSGERAIQRFFSLGNGASLTSDLTLAQKDDFMNFDGNANTFRLLSHSFVGRRQGGFSLTYPTLASIIKYPRPSMGVKKFGYFQQDEETFLGIMRALGIPLVDSRSGLYARFPLVFLVEAADDISYQAMDVEDAYKLGILSFDETRDLFLGYFHQERDANVYDSLSAVMRQVSDKHEVVAYLRTLVIGRLVERCADAFCSHADDMLNGTFRGSLIGAIDDFTRRAMSVMAATAVERIYRHQMVAKVELSGFTILGTLLDKFTSALLMPHDYYSGLILPFIPEQYRVPDTAPVYDKMLSALDTVSGMTDLYALELYKRITGSELH